MPALRQRRQPSLSVLAGYVRVERAFEHFQPLMDWLVVEEELERDAVGGLVLPRQDHAKIGRVLKVGDRASVLAGLEVNDRVVYTEYAGGRWAFPDPARDDGVRRVLIMEHQDVLVRLIEE